MFDASVSVLYGQGMVSTLPISELPETPAFVGVAGSHSQGLDHADSDVDFRGCYITPTRELHRLSTPPDTYVHNDPDVTMYEVAKLLRLAISANPAALEAFFYTDYVLMSRLGFLLLKQRYSFLTQRIRDTHIGFARSGLTKAEKWYRSNKDVTDPERVRKHYRHLLRTIRLASTALETGEYTLQVANRDEIFAFGELPYHVMRRDLEAEISRVQSIKSDLPPEADYDAIDTLLVDIREQS